MKLNKLHNALVFLLCVTIVACNKNTPVQNGTDQSGKTPITLSIGGVDSQDMTRAVISSDDGKTMRAFPKGSSIYMLFMANEVGGSGFKTTRTIGFAQDQNPETDKSDISYTASQEGTVFIRYWEDAYARKTALSVAAVSTPGYGPNKAGATAGDNKTWKIGGQAGFQNIPWTSPGGGDIESSTYVDWPISSGADDQSAMTPNFITFQDLCFSNNIGDNSDKGKTDTRIKFDTETKRFGAGTLIFNHALSKLTFRIKKGDGFTDSEFKFNTGTNIKLSNFFRSGRFIIGTGEFTKTSPNEPKIGDINKINQRSTPESGDKFTLDALVIPGTDMTTSDDAVTFYINHNEYKLTRAQLYNAILKGSTNAAYLASHTGKVDPTILAEAVAESGDGRLLRAGVHYIFTFTVSKTQVSGITAQVADWEEVTADNINPTNARISLQLEDRGTALTKGVDFYRAKDTGNSAISDTYQGYLWSSGYEKGTGDFVGTTWKPTNWYWPDNTTFYHFRAVGEKKDASPSAPIVSNNAFALAAGQSYKDYIWGAPFKELDGSSSAPNNTKIKYSPTYGFDGTFDGSQASTHQIYFGIGPTTDPIKLLMFHMMSDVTVIVQSVSGDGAVALTVGGEKTTIHFENIYTGGSVALGNGLVSTTGDATTTGDLTMSSTDNQWLYGAIPQNLDGATTATTDDVILVITTPDHNQYKVSMKNVKASAVTEANIANPYSKVGGDGADKDYYIIDRWYPGFKYVYTFKLSKKKIEDITATIVNWETVSADEEVQIQ